MKKCWQTIKKYIPVWSIVLFILFLAALIVKAVAQHHPVFADRIHDTSGVVIRTALSYLTCYLPFSVAEYLLISSPVLIVLICIEVVRLVIRSPEAGIRYCAGYLYDI